MPPPPPLQVSICDLTVTDLSYAASAFYCGKLVLACSIYDGGLFPPMKAFLDHLQTKGFRNRRIGPHGKRLIGLPCCAADARRVGKDEGTPTLWWWERGGKLRGALNQTSEAQMDALVAELCAE